MCSTLIISKPNYMRLAPGNIVNHLSNVRRKGNSRKIKKKDKITKETNRDHIWIQQNDKNETS